MDRTLGCHDFKLMTCACFSCTSSQTVTSHTKTINNQHWRFREPINGWVWNMHQFYWNPPLRWPFHLYVRPPRYLPASSHHQLWHLCICLCTFRQGNLDGGPTLLSQSPKSNGTLKEKVTSLKYRLSRFLQKIESREHQHLQIWLKRTPNQPPLKSVTLWVSGN